MGRSGKIAKKQLKEVADVNRRRALGGYVAMLIILCLYVPWAQDGIIAGKPFHYNAGYSFIWSPIKYAYVDITRVVLPMIALTAAFGFAWWQLKE